MAETGKDLARAKMLLEQNELVAIPTETVYGLAANALNTDAVAKIFETKNRPSFDPLIVHVPTLEAAQLYVEEIPEKLKLLAHHFWPGPLTLLVAKKDQIPDLVTSGLDTVGIRCPNHALTRALLEQLPFPLAAPSANPFGYVSPTKPEHVEEQLGKKIEYILDGGPCLVGIESTIVGMLNNRVTVFRLGGLSIEEIEKVVGKVDIMLHSSSNPQAPGQLQSHYAPSKKVIIGNISDRLQQFSPHTTAVLSFQHNYSVPYQFILSPSGSLTEAAKNLFLAVRQLDKLPVDTILTELVPNEGLGRAINDRLTRAAH
jgi:L-threonylcarbamoyladenylate synthase